MPSQFCIVHYADDPFSTHRLYVSVRSLTDDQWRAAAQALRIAEQIAMEVEDGVVDTKTKNKLRHMVANLQEQRAIVLGCELPLEMDPPPFAITDFFDDESRVDLSPAFAYAVEEGLLLDWVLAEIAISVDANMLVIS